MAGGLFKRDFGSLRLSSVIVKPELLSLAIKQHKFYKAAI